jgi:hypothetical protein
MIPFSGSEDGVKTFHEADVVQMHEGLIRDSVVPWRRNFHRIRTSYRGGVQYWMRF